MFWFSKNQSARTDLAITNLGNVIYRFPNAVRMLRLPGRQLWTDYVIRMKETRSACRILEGKS
jgi:hypothetical protein